MIIPLFHNYYVIIHSFNNWNIVGYWIIMVYIKQKTFMQKMRSSHCILALGCTRQIHELPIQDEHNIARMCTCDWNIN